MYRHSVILWLGKDYAEYGNKYQVESSEKDYAKYPLQIIRIPQITLFLGYHDQKPFEHFEVIKVCKTRNALNMIHIVNHYRIDTTLV